MSAAGAGGQVAILTGTQETPDTATALHQELPGQLLLFPSATRVAAAQQISP